jgi:hypothetical protein
MHICQQGSTANLVKPKQSHLKAKKKTLVIAMPVYKNTPNPDGQFSPFVWLQAIYKTVQVRQKMSI